MRPENVPIKLRKIAQAEAAHARSGDRYVPPPAFTCDDCEAAPSCSFAFDDYNTDGDCLALK